MKEKRPLVVPSLKQNLKYLGIAVLLMIPAAHYRGFYNAAFIKLKQNKETALSILTC